MTTTHPARMICVAFLGVFVCMGLTPSSQAQTSYPMITHTVPTAVQRGKTMDVIVNGQMNFFGAYKVLMEGSGLAAEIVATPPPSANPPQKPLVRAVTLKITAAPEAALGVREFRIASSLGVSSIGQLIVTDDPVVQEKGSNNTLATANPIIIPGAVCGIIEAAEDVDYFKFRAEAGQTIAFEVFCARIQDKIHDLQKHADPLIALFDADGRELAANDDFFFADSLLTYTIAKSGDYSLQIRDSKYDGDPRWTYVVLATSKPYVSHVYPMAGNPGQMLEVDTVGSVKGKQTLQVPTEPGLHSVPLSVNGIRTNPTTLFVSPLPQVREQEPNDAPEKATQVSIPCGINGRIGTKRDLDHFTFAATKGKPVRFEVKARRFGTILQSSLDSILDVLDAKGAILASNDDTLGKDAALVFTPAADGNYVLRIRDLNNKGGESWVYFIEADWAVPDFTLRCDPDKAMIGPGSSTAWYVHVVRSNGFAGPVQVDVQGLPPGVTASPLTIPPAMTQGVIVLTAAADARPDAAKVQLVGTATVKTPDGKEEKLTRRVTPNQEIYSPGGGRARFDVNLQTVAVTEASDILKVEVVPNTIRLKPGEEVKLDVTIHRRQDYDKTVSLDIPLRHLGTMFGSPLPPGVTMVEGKSKTLLGTGSKGHIVLKADPKAAPLENVPICVQAHVSINFVVKVSYSSPAILLSIEK